MIRVDSAGYPVTIGRGLLDEAGPLLPPGRQFIVTDENVESAGWPARIAAAAGPRLLGIRVLPPGEGSKNIHELERLLDALLEAGVERGDCVIAVGGGVIGDLAGFAAAVLKRGCGFVQVPTTLLAQADAAIGGKTAINSRQGKNLIGAFHRPEAVLIDIATLETLPPSELRSGYAEVVKYGLIGNPGFFGWCEAHAEALLAGDETARLHAVATSVRAKIAIVARDERDTGGPRALLNFGHSFAHAIEAETGMAHGEAVALGMTLAFRLSAQRGLCQPADAERVSTHLRAVGLPTRLEATDPAALVARMAHDKKRRHGLLRLVLARGIGEAFVEEGVEPAQVEAFLERELSSAGLPVA
ncbi:MAG TPA: 3-dehydroquinate synthase [Allosphingosinicella sp.]|nr:3-dehydroquinate synthase [Allosphingosinicella sp.]